ncbi:hypothetical protein [Sphingomonas aracearum]|uniref:hypothetical protein n=1 Tax=Sphingomonas aracearum TaxID=2283317 RepID=UPI0011C021D9|nr:hypothetical protein [Sphingomonas aracearum]
MTMPNDAADALAAMQDARVRANALRPLPFTYHLAFGALMAGWVYIQNLSLWRFSMGLLLLIAAGCAMYQWQRHATGRFVSGWRRGRTFAVALAIVAIMLGLLVTSAPSKFPDHQLFEPWQGAALAFLAGAFGDWLWMKAYAADLRAAR